MHIACYLCVYMCTCLCVTRVDPSLRSSCCPFTLCPFTLSRLCSVELVALISPPHFYIYSMPQVWQHTYAAMLREVIVCDEFGPPDFLWYERRHVEPRDHRASIDGVVARAPVGVQEQRNQARF